MLLPLEKVKHLNSIVHEGKVLLFATDKDGIIYYSVQQNGYENNYQSTKIEGWENWVVLPLPDEVDDRSVLAREKELLSYESEDMSSR